MAGTTATPGTGGGGAATGGSSGGLGGGGASSGGASNGGTGGGSDNWDTYAKGFMTMYCVSCHNDDNQGTASRDYHMLAAVEDEADKIACGVAKSQDVWAARGCSGFPPAKQFPVGDGAKPTDQDRDRLIAWIDAGMP